MKSAPSKTGNCARCGRWIPSHGYHACIPPAPVPTATVTLAPTSGEQLIAAALNRIAAALEQLAARESHDPNPLAVTAAGSGSQTEGV